MLRKSLIPSANLIEVRRRALRRGVWFRILNHVERGILDLTIGCVDRVRSRKLVDSIVKILAKLTNAMKSRFVRLMETVGTSLAQKMARLASSWGNEEARKWAEEKTFIQYLTIIEMNAPIYIQR